MEQLNFTFKKTRRFGDLIQDYISLFKIIFKHLSARIIGIALPFIAVFILLFYYLTTFFSEMMKSSDPFSSLSSVAFIPIGITLLIFLFFILISSFGIEYMLLLEERKDLNFTSNDIYKKIKSNLGKYFLFFLSSIPVGLVLLVPFVILAFIFNFIPVLGQLAMGVASSCMLLFFNIALYLYLQNREGIWDSYRASFRLVKGRIFEYGAASYVLQILIQIILTLITLIPLGIVGVIAFTTVGFSDQFFDGFMGKFLASIGGAIFMVFLIFAGIYLVVFYVLQYFSLLESSYKEDTLEQIDQIGGTADEF